jgi:hypothetical protein
MGRIALTRNSCPVTSGFTFNIPTRRFRSHYGVHFIVLYLEGVTQVWRLVRKQTDGNSFLDRLHRTHDCFLSYISNNLVRNFRGENLLKIIQLTLLCDISVLLI